ncbi:MAG TPA: tetratricopeptide repeat protein [Candidatus Hydrogenedentes bacterium]|nr:tetratricopeptide repeat protein [Candidatus Hydrogenedentota bacterium]
MDAKTAEQYFHQADGLYQSGKYAEALELLNVLNKEFPNTKNVMYAAALCLEKLGNIEEAKFVCNSLIRQFDCGKARELLAALEDAPRIDAQLNDLLNKDILQERNRAVPPPLPQRASNKKIYIIAGIAVVVLLLLSLPFFLGNTGSASDSPTEPSLTGIMLPLLLVVLAIYFLGCYLMKRICENAGTEPGVLIWIPILQIIPTMRAADMDFLWLIAIFIPIVGTFIFTLVLWVKLCKACGKPAWFGILIFLPILDMFLVVYLALSSPARA